MARTLRKKSFPAVVEHLANDCRGDPLAVTNERKLLKRLRETDATTILLF
jgi:hypothetical protein